MLFIMAFREMQRTTTSQSFVDLVRHRLKKYLFAARKAGEYVGCVSVFGSECAEERFEFERLGMGAATMARAAGLQRHETSRCVTGIRDGPPLAGRSLECFGAGVGANQDGGPRSPR